MKQKKYIFIIVILIFILIVLSIIAVNLARQTPSEVIPTPDEFSKYKIKPREARYYE